MSISVQTVIKPNPGADIGVIMAHTKDAAAMWRKHGAQVSFWSVTVGEIGNFIFETTFATFEAYGKAFDAIDKDPAFVAWRVSSLKAGEVTYVRANVARQIEV